MVVVISLGAALLYALASVVQQRAAATTASGGPVDPRLVVRLALRPLWLLGIVADVGAFALHALALSFATVVTVQALMASGLLFALVIGAAQERRRVGRRELGGGLAVTVGLSGFLVLGAPEGPASQASAGRWTACLVVTAALGVVAALVSWRASPRLRAGVLAAAGGMLYGVTAAITKSTVDLLGHGLLHLFVTWQPYALAVAAIAGLVLVQNAFQAAPLASSLPALTLVEPIASAAAGAWLFAEHLGHVGRPSAALALLGALLAGVGVWVLGHSPVVTDVLAEHGEPVAGDAPPAGVAAPAPVARR